MRTVGVTLVLALALAACTTAEQPEGGFATYDALKRATAECAAQGGTLTLKKEGDAQSLQAYSCERK